MVKRKIHFMNSALSIPRTFSCALDTFLDVIFSFNFNIIHANITVILIEDPSSKLGTF